MPKPVLSIITNNMGSIITVRAPMSRKWLFNLSISKEIVMQNILFKIGKAILIAIVAAIALFFFFGCDNPVIATFPETPETAMASTRYVRDSVSSKTCWKPWSTDKERDSLFIHGKGYTISERSRYRVATLPSAYLDVLAEGPVFNGDWAIYRDTKSDSIYIFTDCESLKMFNGEDF